MKPEGDKECLLLVEDQRLVREVLAAELRAAGYRVLDAATGGDAVRIATPEASIDLVLSDVFLPDMTAPDLVRRIFVHHDAAVLLMTAFVREARILRDLAVPGHWRILEKPFTTERLLEEVRTVLDARPRSEQG